MLPPTVRRFLALPLLATLAGPLAAQGTTDIYLQRGADGRVVISDQPRRGVAVEKTWRMEREDPDAARQRAAEVRRHAAETSARVQRSIDAQQDRLALAERQRARADAEEAERRRFAELRAEADRPVVLTPWLGPGLPQRQRPPGWRPPGGGAWPPEASRPPRRQPHPNERRPVREASGDALRPR